MNTNDEVPRDDLRKRAEAALADVGREKPPVHPDDIKALIHDLRVHQIELEMQNEELRVSRTSLEVARDKYARLYNQSPVGYISVDKHGIVRKANQTFLDMIDHGTADIRDKPLVDYLSAESRDVFLGRFGAFFRQPMGKTMDIELRGATGRVVVRLSARRVPDDEELLVAVVDIGEQAKAEARVNALLVEKQMLLREVHHRIKNNMNVAMAMLAIQADTIENPEAKTAMEDAGRRMFSMMVIYEKLYRSEDFRTVSSAEYLSQLLDMIREQFSTPGVRVERELADFPLDSSVLFPLGMILNELITNAFKYAFVGKGSGTIRVSLRCDDRGSAKLLVLDDGVGLPSEYLSEGTGGFGSMMIRALTDQIQGTVHASSENGARIAVSFPIVSSCIES